jgi:5-methylcytosine-specific restriction endonuclease McrA
MTVPAVTVRAMTRTPRPGPSRAPQPCGICGQRTTSMTGFCQRTPECKQAHNREYNQIRPEVKRQVAKRWRDNHPEEARASWKRHRQKPGRTCRYAECDNTVQPGQSDCPDCQAAVRQVDRQALVRRDGPDCSWCGELLPDDLDAAAVDHIIPVSRGGPRDPLWNRQVLHKACNIAKSNSVTERALEAAAQHGYRLTIDGHRLLFFREQLASAMVCIG